MIYFSKLITCCLLFFSVTSSAQVADRWQQRISYDMEVELDTAMHHVDGKQEIEYWNNSPDTLYRVFFHLYFNAFQPNSMMDVKSRTIRDPDPRVGNRIQKLDSTEIGYQKINRLTHRGKDVSYKVEGTILEVDLNEPILPGEKTSFYMEFESQVPLQIRRSGRDNKEGIDYSMSQWYPKMSEYDYMGWHATPYVGREFHGVWGDFEVSINLPSNYIVGATGVLTNKSKVETSRASKDRTTWHFKADRVHDFVWAADPDYTHVTYQATDGPMMHFYYQKNEQTEDAWSRLPEIMNVGLQFIQEHYGEYPYPKYSFIQGGDGGMEYPMATLITGERSLPSLVGVSVHEIMHAWYHTVLATNESLYPWMDEGFTTYATAEVMRHIREKGMLPEPKTDKDPQASNVTGYVNFSKSKYEEPMTTHADHYETNMAYGVNSYVKGAVFLYQLEYILGKEDFNKGLKRYFETWKFKHPNPNDFIRVMEKQSLLELDWYRKYWVQTTHKIDYAVDTVQTNEMGSTSIRLRKIGQMPMPLDVVVTKKNGQRILFHIPLRIMRGHKTFGEFEMDVRIEEDWPWTHPTYTFQTVIPMEEIEKIEVDPSGRMSDVNRSNNLVEMNGSSSKKGDSTDSEEDEQQKSSEENG